MRNLFSFSFLVIITFCCPQCSFGQNNPTIDITPEHSFTVNCEGPNVDTKGNLFVVNYKEDGTIAIIPPEKPASLFLTLPKGSTANSIQFAPNGDFLLADFSGHNVLKVNHLDLSVSVFAHDPRFNQPNDLCITRSGTLYASDPDWAHNSGQIWKITPDGKITLLEMNMGTTNGIELSPDEKTLYVNESNQNNIWKYEVTEKGLQHKTLFYKYTDHGLDGMKCDKEGNLYVACWGNGVIGVLSPEGKLIKEIPVKGKKVSNLTFGGPDGKTVFVTLQDRGCVESFQNDIPGKWFK